MSLEYPLIDDFQSDHSKVVEGFHRRFPNARIPRDGAGNQHSRFRLTDDRDFIIAGLGLSFELLYFKAREQLRNATNEVVRYRLKDAVARYNELRRSGRPRSSP